MTLQPCPFCETSDGLVRSASSAIRIQCTSCDITFAPHHVGDSLAHVENEWNFMVERMTQRRELADAITQAVFGDRTFATTNEWVVALDALIESGEIGERLADARLAEPEHGLVSHLMSIEQILTSSNSPDFLQNAYHAIMALADTALTRKRDISIRVMADHVRFTGTAMSSLVTAFRRTGEAMARFAAALPDDDFDPPE